MYADVSRLALQAGFVDLHILPSLLMEFFGDLHLLQAARR